MSEMFVGFDEVAMCLYSQEQLTEGKQNGVTLVKQGGQRQVAYSICIPIGLVDSFPRHTRHFPRKDTSRATVVCSLRRLQLVWAIWEALPSRR